MKVLDVAQRSPEWIAARLGKLTSTCAADMLATTKSGGEAAARRNLRVKLVLERLTGRSVERGYVSQAMQDGIDNEPLAAAAFEALSGEILHVTGFIEHDSLLAGCSLDGHTGTFDQLVEIKCPTPAVHLEYLRSGKVPYDYLQQVRHALWITGALRCEWLSFCPAFPEPLQAKLIAVERGEVDIPAYERAAVAFLAEVDREYEAVATMGNLRGQLEKALA
jgi:hypothetical protein